MSYQPDSRLVTAAAYNKMTPYLPLYEHNVCLGFFDKITNSDSSKLLEGDLEDKKEFFRRYTAFMVEHHYDVVPFEGCVVELVQNGEGLMGYGKTLLKDKDDILAYPWEAMEERYFERFAPFFEALKATLPPG